jgi:hypothetical protein
VIDRHSETWREIETWAKRELDAQLRILKNPSTSPADTQVARGEIARLEALIALPDPKAKLKIDAGVRYEP